jgi:hypothetical protein
VVDVRSGPFLHRAILRARVAGDGEQDRPTGTSEHTDRVSDLLMRERERALLSEREWPSFCRERASGVERIRHRRDNNMHLDVRKKATQACVSSTNLLVTDFIAHYQYGSDQ